MEEHDFAWALGVLKRGGEVSRTGWNGKAMRVEMQVPDTHSKMSLPYLYLHYVERGERVPWLASQTDILADDWQEGSN